ncbi:hypothetical protein [Pseudomonas monachiensis]|uniref:Uncharacterized protein n=1 Tax=Pseudomonas monachiensis TaxID=3060212 RepID=A0ABW9H7W0_9PSED
MTPGKLIFGAFGGAVLLTIFIWMGLALYLSYTKIDVMLKHLKNSTAVMALSHYRRLGAWGHLHLIAGIAALVAFPDRYIKNGTLSADDINSLPASLKRKLVIWRWGVLILCGLLLLLGGVGAATDWI